MKYVINVCVNVFLYNINNTEVEHFFLLYIYIYLNSLNFRAHLIFRAEPLRDLYIARKYLIFAHYAARKLDVRENVF